VAPPQQHCGGDPSWRPRKRPRQRQDSLHNGSVVITGLFHDLAEAETAMRGIVRRGGEDRG